MPITPETRNDLAILGSLNYLNTTLIPEVAPAHAPFHRTLIEVSAWLSAPKVIQLSLVVLTTSCQKSRTTLIPSLDKDLCRVRGNCLNELMSLVSDVTNERYALAFDCIQLMMLAEMQLEPTASWSYHLDAARRLINMQGGSGSVFYKSPSLQGMLINYMEVDIMTCITCPARSLSPGDVRLQSSYIPLLAHREKKTITTACFSPIPIFQATVEINNLRVKTSHPGTSPPELSTAAAEFTRISSAISAFNPPSWATRILNYAYPLEPPFPIAPPNIDQTNLAAMTTLAHCHQDASTLYLHLSCPQALQPSQSHSQTQTLSMTHANLTSNLQTLLSQASADTEAAIHTQLFKFAIWPLFVAAYACVGSDLGDSCGEGGEIGGVALVKQVARMIDSRPLRIAAEVLEGIAERRTAGGGAGGGWKWDDAFEGRCSFCVL